MDGWMDGWTSIDLTTLILANRIDQRARFFSKVDWRGIHDVELDTRLIHVRLVLGADAELELPECGIDEGLLERRLVLVLLPRRQCIGRVTDQLGSHVVEAREPIRARVVVDTHRDDIAQRRLGEIDVALIAEPVTIGTLSHLLLAWPVIDHVGARRIPWIWLVLDQCHSCFDSGVIRLPG
jgi:hypothetical protein